MALSDRERVRYVINFLLNDEDMIAYLDYLARCDGCCIDELVETMLYDCVQGDSEGFASMTDNERAERVGHDKAPVE